jgi:hypothetical protein
MFNHPQRMAWATLGTAFLVLCFACVGSITLIRYALFEFPMDLNTTVFVGRGTVGVVFVNDNRETNVGGSIGTSESVGSGDRIRVDELSQGSLVIADPINADNAIVTVQLMGGSQFRLRKATRPRFLGDTPFVIRMSDVVGELEVVISTQLERDIRMELEGGGQTIRLDHGGQYLITVRQDELRVEVREGEALLLDNNNRGTLVKHGELGIANQNGISVDVANALPDNLVNNNTFDEEGASPRSANVWGCNFKPSEVLDIDGIFERVFYDGRNTMHFERLADRDVFPGETRCFERLDVNVEDYEELYIRVSLYIAEHSLPRCGQLGTECPLMLRMRYQNADQRDAGEGARSDWVHGFYSHDNGAPTSWPLRCSACDGDHDRVNQGTWYTYISQDFIGGLSADHQGLRPIEIYEIEFYAGGHKYEVYVGEVSILGRRANGQVEDIVGISLD